MFVSVYWGVKSYQLSQSSGPHYLSWDLDHRKTLIPLFFSHSVIDLSTFDCGILWSTEEFMIDLMNARCPVSTRFFLYTVLDFTATHLYFGLMGSKDIHCSRSLIVWSDTVKVCKPNLWCQVFFVIKKLIKLYSNLYKTKPPKTKSILNLRLIIKHRCINFFKMWPLSC